MPRAVRLGRLDDNRTDADSVGPPLLDLAISHQERTDAFPLQVPVLIHISIPIAGRDERTIGVAVNDSGLYLSWTLHIRCNLLCDRGVSPDNRSKLGKATFAIIREVREHFPHVAS